MKKFLYDKLVEEAKTKSIEELVQRDLAGSEIECADRAFANQCGAGMCIADINRIFEIANQLKAKFSYKLAQDLEDAISDAEESWNYIRSGINKMNDPERYYNELTKIQNNIKNATNKNDSI